MKTYGLTPDDLPQVKRDKTSWAYFIEPHIEQGPVLESENLSVGIVDTIVGIRTKKLILTGRPDHGGTTPIHRAKNGVDGRLRLEPAACGSTATRIQWQNSARQQ